MWFLILLTLVVGAVVAWKFRVQILARVLGQPESRIERQLKGPKG